MQKNNHDIDKLKLQKVLSQFVCSLMNEWKPIFVYFRLNIAFYLE